MATLRLALLFTLFAGIAAIGADVPADPPRRVPPQVNEQNRKFWSFQPVKRPEVPQVKDQAWVKNPIDAFVLAKLEAKGFVPAPAASKTAAAQACVLRPDRPSSHAGRSASFC